MIRLMHFASDAALAAALLTAAAGLALAAEPALPEGLVPPSPPAQGGFRGARAAGRPRRGAIAPERPGGETIDRTARVTEQRRSLRESLTLTGFWEMRAGCAHAGRPLREGRVPRRDAPSAREREEPRRAPPSRSPATSSTTPSPTTTTTSTSNTGGGWFDLREANAASARDGLHGRQGRPADPHVGHGRPASSSTTSSPRTTCRSSSAATWSTSRRPSDAVKVELLLQARQPRRRLHAAVRPRPLHHGRARLATTAGCSAAPRGRDAVVRADVPRLVSPTTRSRRGSTGTSAATSWPPTATAASGRAPAASTPRPARATFPALSVYGASGAGQLAGGIGNVEVGYYDSRDDRDGDDPFVNNSQLRFLAGYERGPHRYRARPHRSACSTTSSA